MEKKNSDESTKTNLVCLKPFQWLEIAYDQSVYMCCSGWLSKSIGNVSDTPIKEIWGSDAARDIKNSVIDGSFKYCSKEFCPYLKNKIWPVVYVDNVEYAALAEKASAQGEKITPPESVNCSYDQSCNLSCPSCRTNVVMATNPERKHYDKLADDILRHYGKEIKMIHITGSGDPFASRHYWELLQSNKIQAYPELRIRLHTNAQLFDEKHWKKISHIHNQIQCVEVSIDAASESTYLITRRGGDWQKLKKNLDFISNLRKDNAINYLQIDFVVQIENWQEMKEFVVLGRSWGVDKISFSALNNWGTYTQKEYERQAIHKASHPLHYQFVEYLKDDIFVANDIEVGFWGQINFSAKQYNRIEYIDVKQVT